MGKDQGSTNKVDILVEVCNRQPNQDKETDEAFYEQLAEVAQSPALVLMRDFNFTSVLLGGTLPPDLEISNGEQSKPPMVQVETVRDLLLHLDCHKFMGPDGIHLRMLRELAEVIARLYSIIYQCSWSTREVPEDWRV